MTGLRTSHDIACALASDYVDTRSLSEANTRHQVIDVILHDVLSWPRSAVLCESYIDPGYADYVLISNADSQLLFIEAKKEGISFELPQSLLKDSLSGLIKTKTLMTDPEISKTITQARNYCVDSGCELGAVTNGHQWIFFKTFERHSDWRNLYAFVIKSLRYFSDCFTDAANVLGFQAVTENAALAQRLGAVEMKRRERFHPKSQIPEYSHEMHNNYLATCIRPLSDRYLGKMNPSDDAFMQRCYVDVRDYQASISGVAQVIADCLTPYFKNYNVQEFFNDWQGGEFGRRISSHLRERRTREVVILFGGKGAGKSTFIRKLLYHRPPTEIAKHSIIAVVDLLECPEDHKQIEADTWRQLLAELDRDRLLGADRDTLLKLFHDRYDSAKKQILAGLNPTSEAFNIRLNDLVAEWLKDQEYCVQRLADYWKTQQRGTIIVLDNTDQYSPAVQDYCFTFAQQIATLVDGLVVISMREERFHTSRLHGTLDAFQNNGFHLSSPPAQSVFHRRLSYMLRMLDDKEAARNISPTLTDSRNEEVKALLRILADEFHRKNSHLSQFLSACSHGNMRLSLEMFRHFLLSGYTKVDEMLKAGKWNLQVHQVLRPMMIPDRFFYDESLSSIPNIYKVRSDTSGSHFTGLRVLDAVSENVSPQNPVFISVARLKALFANRYRMLDDLYQNLDMMLRKGLLESNNRLDEYSDSVDAVKITPYGFYMRNTLCGMFSYMDLVSVDCSIHEESVAHSLAGMARKELEMFFKGVKGDRIELRLARVEEFIEYLCREAAAERDYYSLDAHEVRYAAELQAAFIEEREKVRGSAKRYIEKQQSPDFTTGNGWD